MKHLNRLAALLGVLFMLLLFAGRSNAQFPGRAPAMNPSGMMRDMKFGPLALLARSKVQKELKLNKSQNEAVKKLQKEQATIFSEKTKGGRGGDTAQMMETIKQVQAAHVEPGTRAKAVRTDEQRQRLGEIRLQAMGLEAFQDPEVQTALGMTPDQKTNLSALNTKPSM